MRIFQSEFFFNPRPPDPLSARHRVAKHVSVLHSKSSAFASLSLPNELLAPLQATVVSTSMPRRASADARTQTARIPCRHLREVEFFPTQGLQWSARVVMCRPALQGCVVSIVKGLQLKGQKVLQLRLHLATCLHPKPCILANLI